MKCNLINFEEDNIKCEEMKSVLNTLCGIQTDDVIDTNFTIGILNDLGKLKFYCITSDSFEFILKQKLKIIYPEIEFKPFDIKFFENQFITNSKFCQMGLKYSFPKTLQTQNQENTFMKNLLGALYSQNNDCMNIIEMSFHPICTYSNIKQKQENKKIKVAKAIAQGLLKVTTTIIDVALYGGDEPEKKKQEKDEEETNECIKFNYNVAIKMGTYNKEYNDLTIRLRSISSTFSQLNYSNIFTTKEIHYNDMFNRNNCNLLLSTDEISQFLYLPTTDIMEDIVGKDIAKILVDKNVPEEGIVIAKSPEDKPLAIPAPDIILTLKNYSKNYKKYAKYIDNICKPKLAMGLPGSGKSEWLVNYAINCLKWGIPFILIDPKFDSQKRLIESIPDKYIKDIDFLDLGDLMYPPALNIFRRRKENDVTENGLITTSFISYMKKQFERNWGYNIERMLQMTTDAILQTEVATMTEFYWMLKEQIYRQTILEIIKSKLDEPKVENRARLRQLLAYWNDYEERYQKNPVTVSKEVEPIMNKIGVFIGNRFINAIVSQRESYDFKDSGDKRKSVIINVPEGIINRENMALLCGFVNKAVWIDYQSRDDMDMSLRYPVQWLIDEAGTVVDEEFAGILTKARSRRLGILLAAQEFIQFDSRGMKMSDSVRDNCTTKFVFRIGYSDARALADEFAPLTANNLNNCPDHYFYSRILLADGTISKPFFGYPLPVAEKLRDYDEFKKKHRSGKLTIGEIEDDIENRLDGFKVAMALTQ